VEPRELIRQICVAREVTIIRGAVSPDHVRMLVAAPPQLAPSKLVQFIKVIDGDRRTEAEVVRLCRHGRG
jgi:REP element-mobilizing transposase RayT